MANDGFCVPTKFVNGTSIADSRRQLEGRGRVASSERTRRVVLASRERVVPEGTDGARLRSRQNLLLKFGRLKGGNSRSLYGDNL
jgi:hypothetical protein